MPRADFYLLSEPGEQARWRCACRLAEKAADLGHRVFVRTGSATETAKLDDLLWTYSDKVFLGHEVGTQPTHPLVKVLVSEESAATEFDVIINLSQSTDGLPPRVERVAEIVDAEEAAKRAARDRYRHYRELGWTLETHNL